MQAWGGLHPMLQRAVVKLGLKGPTQIQQLSLGQNATKTWRDSLLLAETGSGKTLAYLLPLLHRLKEIEESTAVRARPRRPRALIIVPTRELGDQVLAVAKSLSHVARFSAASAFGGGSRAEELDVARLGGGGPRGGGFDGVRVCVQADDARRGVRRGEQQRQVPLAAAEVDDGPPHARRLHEVGRQEGAV